jgi:hypothetical protein
MKKTGLRIAGITAVKGLFSIAAATTAGAAGAATLSSAGHDGYSPLEAAQMGAIGAGILAPPYFAIVECLALLPRFRNSEESETSNATCKFIRNQGLYYLTQIVHGLTGFAVMNAINPTTMRIDKTVAAFATGTVLTIIPLGLVALGVVIPLLYLLITKCTDHDEEETSQRVYSTF